MIRLRCTSSASSVVLLLALAAYEAAAAQEIPLLAAPTERGAALRWAWVAGERPLGYHVERRTVPAGPWVRLTASPVAAVRDRARVREILGAGYERHAPLLFPTDPQQALVDPESRTSLLLLAADLDPRIADVLGLRFVDDEAGAGLYEYRLVAVRPQGEAVGTGVGPIETGAYDAPPGPAPLEASQAAAGVELTWPGDPAFTAYNVYRSVGDGAAVRLNQGPIVLFSPEPGARSGPARSAFIDPSPPGPGAVAHYQVEGVDALGRPSRRTARVTVRIRDVVPPQPPPLLAASVRGDTVLVAWRASPSPDVAEYQVWRVEERDGSRTAVGGPVPRGDTTAADPGRPVRVLSWYHVTAIDSAGNESEPSFTALAEVPDLSPPPAPLGLTGTAEVGRIRLLWAGSPAADLLGYRVYRASAARREYGLLTAEPVTGPTYQDPIRVEADHAFLYRVTAVDSAFNESGPSEPLSISPPDSTPPSPPLLISAAGARDGVRVRWLRNPEPDVVAYTLFWRARGDSAWTEATTVSAEATHPEVLLPALPPGLMEVTALAVDDVGNRSPLGRQRVVNVPRTPSPEGGS